jgi:TadE-like protein
MKPRDERGTALVELALVLPLLLVLLLGMADFGKAMTEWIDETHLASEGARLASVSYCPDNSQADCGWAALKGCPASVVTAGPLSCIAWYLDQHADIAELKPITSGGTAGRDQDSYAPAQNAARICIWYPDASYPTASSRCTDHCTESPSTAPRPGDRVQVTMQVVYRWLNYLTTRINLPSTPLSGQASMRLEAPRYH